MKAGVDCAQRKAYPNLSHAIEQAQSVIQTLEDYKEVYPDIFKSSFVQTALMKVQDLQSYLLHYLEDTSSDLLNKQIQQKQQIINMVFIQKKEVLTSQDAQTFP